MFGYFFIVIGLLVFTILCNQYGKTKAALIALGLTLFFVYLSLDIYKIHDVAFYEENFYLYKNYSLSQIDQIHTYEEPGYIAFNIIISKIFPNFRFFYFVYAIIVISAYLIYIKRYSCNVWFSGMLLVFSFFYPLFLMRQYLAITICLFSIPFIFKKKPIIFFAFVFLAFLFHRTALAFSVCYFLTLVKLNKKGIAIAISVGALALFSIGSFNTIFEQTVTNMELASHYMAYLKEGSTNSWKAAAIPVANLLFAILCYRKHFYILNQMQSFFFFMCGIYAILAIVDIFGTIFAGIYRITPYFALSIMIMIPDAAKYIKSKAVRSISTAVILILNFFDIYNTASPWFHLTF